LNITCRYHPTIQSTPILPYTHTHTHTSTFKALVLVSICYQGMVFFDVHHIM
jgi:hypothetical protein